MAGFVQAVALDLDGTIAHDGAVSPEALEAIAAARADGVFVLLVTGRILDELDGQFPGLGEKLDAVVGENGAVLRSGGVVRALAPPVDEALARRLGESGIAVRRGRVLLACSAADLDPIVHLVAELGLDCQLVRNRGELMVLPAGVSKGTGLAAALAEFGVSAHNALAAGDAENDLALLEAAELGVAVANAVPSLRAHADVVLDETDGTGIARLLTGPLVRGTAPVRPARRRVELGRFVDGGTAAVAGAQANILVCGASGGGKSHLAGLLVERWVTAGYTVLVIDMEGDHIGLGRLRNAVIAGDGELPGGHELMVMLRQQGLSVVLDVSRLAAHARLDYLRRVAAVVEAERAAYGVPHWIVIDEAHMTLGPSGVAAELFRPADLGYCLVTYLPDQLTDAARAAMDVVLTVAASDGNGPGAATLAEAGSPARLFVPAPRHTPHRRHWHKYTDTLPAQRWFRFHDPAGGPPAAAPDLGEFVRLLREAAPAVVEFHLVRGDFSRWLLGTVQDRELGAAVAATERDLIGRRAADVERARERILRDVDDRYGQPAGRSCERPGAPGQSAAAKTTQLPW